MSRAVLFLLLLVIVSNAYAGDGDEPKKSKSSIPAYLYPGTLSLKKTKAQPDVPGTLIIDIGSTFLNQAPSSMNTQWWGSFTFNFAYLYEFVIGESNFSFNIGPGVGIERNRFSTNVTLGTVAGDELTIVEPVSDVLPNATEVKRTLFETVYIDVPLEVRYHTNKYDFKRSIKISVGGKVGYRIDSKTKIVYKEFGNTKKFKSKENFNFENFRYGVLGRFGWRGIGVFYYHSISPLFRSNRGPEQTNAYNSVFGIYLMGF